MIDFNYYKETFRGNLGEEVFNDILPKAIDIMTLYANELCNSRLELTQYGVFDKAICYQIDCLNQFDLDSINGAVNEGGISQIKTDNYTIDYSKTNRNYFMYRGIPLSSMTRMLMANELYNSGHYKLLVG